MAYEEDFRIRVVRFSFDGNSIRETSRTFKVANSQICAWRKKHKSGEPLKSKTPNREHLRKVTPDKIDALLLKNPNALQKNMASEFSCTEESVCVALKKFGFSRKKNKRDTWKRVQ